MLMDSVNAIVTCCSAISLSSCNPATSKFLRIPFSLLVFNPTYRMGQKLDHFKRGLERKMTVFRQYVHFTGGKSAKKFLYVNTLSDNVVKHSLAYLSMQK